MPTPFDPQLDVNVLIGLIRNAPEMVAYAVLHQAAGLSYNEPARDEFLAKGRLKELQDLKNRFGLRLIQDLTLGEINAAAARLQSAFAADSLNRTLALEDARVAAGAFLKNETLATADLQLYKRARDLGLRVEYVGTAAASARARAYVPRPMSIPPP